MITPQQIVKEVQRELNMRRKVYTQWVRDGKLTQETADHRIAIMQAILSDYEEKIAQENPEQPSLF